MRRLAARVVLALFAVPGAAGAAPTWLAGIPLSTPGATSSAPSVAIGDSGDAIAVWSETTSTGAAVVRAAVHPVGGSWTPLAGPVSGGLPGSGCEPAAAIDGSGNAIVVWSQVNTCGAGTTRTLFAAQLASGATTFGAPAVVGTTPDAPVVATGPAGEIVTMWQASDTGTGSLVVWAASGTASGGFAPAARVVTETGEDSASQLSAAIDARGDAAVQWLTSSSTSTFSNLELSVRPSGGTWPATPTAVTANMAASDTAPSASAVGIDDAGDVLTVYGIGNAGTSASHYWSRLLAAAATLQPAEPIATVPAGMFPGASLAVSMDAAGDATAAWLDGNWNDHPFPPQGIESAVRPAGAASPWIDSPSLVNVTDIVDEGGPIMLDESPGGAAVLAWTDAQTPLGFFRSDTSPFGAPAGIGGGSATSAVIAPSGDAVLATLDAGVTRVSTLDQAGPALGALAVPAATTTGTPVSMSVQARDAWSQLAAGQPRWDFGDGTTGAGPSVSHIYALPGAYTVTSSATDGVGNNSAATRHIVVTAASVTILPAHVDAARAALTHASFSVVWRAGHTRGKVLVHGSLTTAATLALRLTRAGGQAVPGTTRRIALPAGPFSTTLEITQNLLPGRYDVVVTGTSPAGQVPPRTLSLTLAAPAQGIVGHAFISGQRSGPPVEDLHAVSQLWAHFTFSSIPARKRAITTQWIPPGHPALPARRRPRFKLVQAQVEDLAGHPLWSGTWRCVLRVGHTVVATVRVHVT